MRMPADPPGTKNPNLHASGDGQWRALCRERLNPDPAILPDCPEVKLTSAFSDGREQHGSVTRANIAGPERTKKPRKTFILRGFVHAKAFLLNATSYSC
jgi:hypothetical protein